MRQKTRPSIPSLFQNRSLQRPFTYTFASPFCGWLEVTLLAEPRPKNSNALLLFLLSFDLLLALRGSKLPLRAPSGHYLEEEAHLPPIHDKVPLRKAVCGWSI